MTTNDDYHPLACGIHSELELLVMRGFRGRVHWQAPEQEQACQARLLDLRARGGIEYLVMETAEGRCEVRLDRLQQIVDPSGSIVWRQ